MREIIILLTKGYVSVIDECDAHLAELNWYANVQSRCVYAMRRDLNSKINRALHRVIIQAPEGMDVDHKNRDTLDNRRSNLRICTRQQNMMNRPPVNGFKGVTRERRNLTKPWKSSLMIDGKHRHLGRYERAEEAALAYDAAAAAAFPEFAWLNRDHFKL